MHLRGPVRIALPCLALFGTACAGVRRDVPTPAAPATRMTQLARPIGDVRHPPTEHWLDADAERRSNLGRRAWIEAMHRAAPGTDWRQIEASNGEALMTLRARLRQAKDFTLDTWTERGSRNNAGRMHSVALGQDGTTLYGGSSHGGAWRGAIDGSSWAPIADNLYGGAHHVAVTSSATGETLLAMLNSGRLRYTIDGGTTWLAPTGLPGDVNRGVRLFADPTNPFVAFVLVGRRSGDWEIHRSDDGGLTWSLQRAIGPVVWADTWMDRVAGGTLWVLAGTEIWSDDLAGTWRQEGTVSAMAVDRVRLAGSEAGMPTLYAALRPPGGTWQLHRSDDAGLAWSHQRDIPDFWETLCASITNPLMVVTGGVEVFRSEDGGAGVTRVNRWSDYYGDPAGKLHADVPGLHVLLLAGRETWFVSTDGGLYRSDDGLRTVRNLSLSDLGVSQYYSTLTSRRNPDRIIAGAQDQGYQRSDGGGPGLLDFDQLISGDYGHLTSSDRTHDWVYSVYPGFVLVHEGELAPSLSQLDFPAGAQLQWMPTVVANPANPQSFYLCADRLWRYDRDVGGVWTSVLDSTQDFTAGGGSTLTALSISPLAPRFRIAVTDAGVVWFTVDDGANWQQSPDPGPSSHYFYGTAAVHSPTNPFVAYLGGSGYSGPAVYRTGNGGRIWAPVGTGLPSTLVYGLAWEARDSDVVYAATEAGPYRLDPATDTWEYIGGTVAPLTTYWSVESVPEVGVIRFGTYGRGIWDWQARVVPEADNCGDGVDNEGDGLVDCLDPDCVGTPACIENCTNGVDDDADGMIDCADADCFTSDLDGDTRRDCDDCAPNDPDMWTAPTEVSGVRVARAAPGGAVVRISWSDDVLIASGPGTLHDVAAGPLPALRGSGWPAPSDCLADDLPGLEQDDGRPSITSEWYLVRAGGACGPGTWGATAAPTPGCP